MLKKPDNKQSKNGKGLSAYRSSPPRSSTATLPPPSSTPRQYRDAEQEQNDFHRPLTENGVIRVLVDRIRSDAADRLEGQRASLEAQHSCEEAAMDDIVLKIRMVHHMMAVRNQL